MTEVSINIFAVLVCGIVALAIGALWYGPIFGKLWMKGYGFTEDDLRKDFNSAKTYGLAVVAHIIAAYVLAYLIGYLNAYSVSGAFHTAFWSWLGFVMMPMFINALFSRKNLATVFIETGYFLVFFILASLIIALWV